MAIALKSTGPRQLKNTLAQWLITLGGISVLFTLVLIFLYLLYVIQPIFESAKIEPVGQFEISTTAPTIATGVDELKEIAFQINQDGIIDFYQLVKSPAYEKGALVLSENLLSGEAKLVDVIRSGVENKLLLDSEGNVQLVAAKFFSNFDSGTREIIPSIAYPLGKEFIDVDENKDVLSKLSFGMNEEKAVFVAFTQDKRLIKTSLIAEDDFTYDSAHEAIYQEIDFPVDHVDEILVTPDMGLAFVRSADQIFVYDLTDEDVVELKATIIPSLEQNSTKPQHVTSMALLSGSSSILIGNSVGKVSQWFEVLTCVPAPGDRIHLGVDKI